MPKAKTVTMIDNAKNLGDEMLKFGRNLYLFGLGTVATAEESVRGVFDTMVSKGETFEKEAEQERKSLVAKATGSAREISKLVEDRVQETITGTLARAGIPSRDEIRTLIERVEQLTDKVETVSPAH